jgi:hypothetical protein
MSVPSPAGDPATNAHRVHATETTWLDRVRATQLNRYDFDASDFTPWTEASGQWIRHDVGEPVAVTAMGNLVDAHREARIELWLVANLWPLVELVKKGRGTSAAFVSCWPCERSGKPVIDDHRKPTLGRCSGRRLVRLARSLFGGVGGGDLEAVVFA